MLKLISEVVNVREADRIRVREPESKPSNFSTLLLHVWTWVGRGQKYVIVSVLAHASLYQRILSAGEMLTTRRVKYAQYRVGIGKSDTPLKRWIYSLINPYTQHLKTPFLDAYIWIWMREKRHDFGSDAFKGNLIFDFPCSTTRMARVRSSFRSSVTWWATRWTPPTIKKRWEMVSFEGSWFLGGLPIAV